MCLRRPFAPSHQLRQLLPVLAPPPPPNFPLFCLQVALRSKVSSICLFVNGPVRLLVIHCSCSTILKIAKQQLFYAELCRVNRATAIIGAKQLCTTLIRLKVRAVLNCCCHFRKKTHKSFSVTVLFF